MEKHYLSRLILYLFSLFISLQFEYKCWHATWSPEPRWCFDTNVLWNVMVSLCYERLICLSGLRWMPCFRWYHEFPEVCCTALRRRLLFTQDFLCRVWSVLNSEEFSVWPAKSCSWGATLNRDLQKDASSPLKSVNTIDALFSCQGWNGSRNLWFGSYGGFCGHGFQFGICCF